jgi:hypothetical protein
MEQAACQHRTDLDWFDLDCYLHACLEVCVTCPVADECLYYAITHELDTGIWGGEWGYRLRNHITEGRGTQ